MRARRGRALSGDYDVGSRELDGVILAGGRGLRMQEADKGLMLLHHRPLVAHVLEALRPQVATCMISANLNAELSAQFGTPLVRDVWPDLRAPLPGFPPSARTSAPERLSAAP